MDKKIVFTLEELIERWLTLFPQDAKHPDLIQMVKGGHVELRLGEHKGKFISHGNYNLIKNIRETSENL